MVVHRLLLDLGLSFPHLENLSNSKNPNNCHPWTLTERREEEDRPFPSSSVLTLFDSVACSAVLSLASRDNQVLHAQSLLIDRE